MVERPSRLLSCRGKQAGRLFYSGLSAIRVSGETIDKGRQPALGLLSKGGRGRPPSIPCAYARIRGIRRTVDNPSVITHVMPMLITTKVRKIGNSLGIVLPKDALQTLRVEEGATLYLTESPKSSLTITPERPGFDVAMRVAAEGMNRYRNALRELAK